MHARAPGAARAEKARGGSPPAGLSVFWGGRDVASGVVRDAGRFMRREAPAWFTG